jgi:hypothetical protein
MATDNMQHQWLKYVIHEQTPLKMVDLVGSFLCKMINLTRGQPTFSPFDSQFLFEFKSSFLPARNKKIISARNL